MATSAQGGRVAVSVALGVALAAVTAAQSPDAAAGFARKLQLLRGNSLSASPAAQRIVVTETELNSYLRYALVNDLPPGVTEPSVIMEGAGRLSARAVVDLDQVTAERRSGGRLDPLVLIGGKVPVTLAGVVRARNGVARLTLESTTISGIEVPQFLVEQLFAHYSRSAEHPDGIGLDEPFPLPAAIREIQFGKGRAVVIQ
jgi:hypothetical protein